VVVVVVVVGSEGRRVVWQASGTERQVRQRRRWRPERLTGGGGLVVQFCAFAGLTLDYGVLRIGEGDGDAGLLYI
jgi:hypothetical protein